jgi:hypothetical protein
MRENDRGSPWHWTNQKTKEENAVGPLKSCKDFLQQLFCCFPIKLEAHAKRLRANPEPFMMDFSGG